MLWTSRSISRSSFKRKRLIEKLTNLLRTFEALSPILGNAEEGQLLKPLCELTEPDTDILCDYDVKIPMSEGFTVTANIYRSKTSSENGEQVPVVMCAHPHDNHLTPALKKTPLGGAPQQSTDFAGRKARIFKLTSWESPDPNFWVASGYAVVNMNMPHEQ